jgi:hypothetical protein
LYYHLLFLLSFLPPTSSTPHTPKGSYQDGAQVNSL